MQNPTNPHTEEPRESPLSRVIDQPDEIPLTRLEILTERLEQLSRETVNALDMLDEQIAKLHKREMDALERIEAYAQSTLAELRQHASKGE